MNMGERLYSTVEVAKALGISRIAVFQKIQSGEIKATKAGRNYVVEAEQLLELLGDTLGENRKREIELAVDRTMSEYGEALRKLGKE
ncbi:MAG: helix-turn-helix domain-containing protein [Patescibacteria group bacterium]